MKKKKKHERKNNNMQDQDVLMIYYNHWGKDEIRARKAVFGLKKTMRSLEEWFPVEQEEETLLSMLRKIFEYDMDVVDRWDEFAQVFLGEAMYFDNEHDFLDDPDELLFDRKVMLEDKLNIFNEETADLIYENDFEYKNVLSVDAIVALM